MRDPGGQYREWILKGIARQDAYLLIIDHRLLPDYDPHDPDIEHDPYPVYLMPGESLASASEMYAAAILIVYDLTKEYSWIG